MSGVCGERHDFLLIIADFGVLLVEDVLEIGEDWRITTFHAGTEKAKLLISGGYNPLLYDGDKYEVAWQASQEL
jgi:hypothetical protein